jgi:hypothetical protein
MYLSGIAPNPCKRPRPGCHLHPGRRCLFRMK